MADKCARKGMLHNHCLVKFSSAEVPAGFADENSKEASELRSKKALSMSLYCVFSGLHGQYIFGDVSGARTT